MRGLALGRSVWREAVVSVMRAETPCTGWEAWLGHSGRQGQIPWRELRASPSRQWHSAALPCQLLSDGSLGLVCLLLGSAL